MHFKEYTYTRIYRQVNTVNLCKCFCNVVRLRILNLVQKGPLCECHIQEILEEPQAKVSRSSLA